MVVTFWDTEEDLQASETEANRLRAPAAQTAAATQQPEVERYEVAVMPERVMA
jgi:heme-degrading monooxygenase HmoA